MINNSDLILIFTKNPVKGNVKTRLAKTVGEDKALDVYKKLLKITLEVTRDLSCKKAVFYDKDIIEEDIWDNDIFIKQKQKGDNLGEKLCNAFQWAFTNDYKRVLVIGSDCPGISSDIITKAFDLLELKEAVLGPADDGGYYLLGMKHLLDPLFRNKSWGSDKVKEETIQDFENNKIDYALLPQLTDIDTEEDLQRFPNIEKEIFSNEKGK